jgi:hypothetical protein
VFYALSVKSNATKIPGAVPIATKLEASVYIEFHPHLAGEREGDKKWTLSHE